MKPLVSVVIPTYNRSRLVVKAIKSVLGQSFQNFEIIVVDDCSTDNTEVRIKAIKDPRIKYIKLNINSGGSYIPRTTALKASVGKYIAVLDDDSYWSISSKLELQVNFLETHKDYILIGTNAISVDQNGATLGFMNFPTSDESIRKCSLTKSCFLHSSLLYRRKEMIEAGGYKVLSLKYYGNYTNDYELWLRLGTIGLVANLSTVATSIVLEVKNLKFSVRWNFVVSLLSTTRSYRKDYPHYYRSIVYWSLILLDTRLPRAIKKILKSIGEY